MRSLIVPLIALSSVSGGEIFGDLRLGEKYLPDVRIELRCGETVAAATTDSTGSYRIRVDQTGKCRLSVSYDQQTPAVDVVVFEKPARYRLILDRVDGKYVVKRV